MIVGTGIDIEEIDRIGNVIERRGDHFLNRIFTKGEQAYCLRRKRFAQHFAARFAAKEACMKALGTGFSRGVRYRDIEVVRKPGERPSLHLHGRAKEIAEEMGVVNISLSITHSRHTAQTLVIFEAD